MSDIYLVDDHALMRDGLRAVLEFAGHHVVGESDHPTPALADLIRLVPTVLLLDLHLDQRSGFELLEQVQRRKLTTRTIMLTMSALPRHVAEAMRLGAYGYVLKSASDERLKLALRSIFVEAQCVIDREVRGMQQKSLGQVRGFSDSEYEILVDIALGLTDRTIARRRGLSIRSVQNRLQQLYEKLGVYQMSVEDSDEGRFNLRARAVTVALLRKLLNYSALERAEAELAEWLRSH